MNVQFKIWRGDASGGEFREYNTEISEGMVVLDAVHDIQATILHLLGLDHTKLTFHFQGRDFRLTDVSGNVIRKLLA